MHLETQHTYELSMKLNTTLSVYPTRTLVEWVPYPVLEVD